MNKAGEQEGLIDLDGKSYDRAAVRDALAFLREVQFQTLESILEKRGLSPTVILEKLEGKGDIDSGCRLFERKNVLVRSLLFGLEFSWHGWDDITKDEFRSCLRDRMQVLGDRILIVWRDDHRERDQS